MDKVRGNIKVLCSVLFHIKALSVLKADMHCMYAGENIENVPEWAFILVFKNCAHLTENNILLKINVVGEGLMP